MTETEERAVLDAEDLLMLSPGAGSSQSPSATSATADSTHVSDSHSFVSTSSAPSDSTASSSSRKKRKRKVNCAKAAQAAKKRSKVTSERDLPTGVYKTTAGKFESRTKWGNKQRYIGTFSTPEQASAAYTSVKKNLDNAKLSAIGPDEVNVIFEASKTKARELFGWINSRKGTGFIDLTGVPPQPLILKNQLGTTPYKYNSRRRPTKESSSKYAGIYYDAKLSKWKAQIMVEGKVRSIGYYDKEEDAAADYARAAYKYKKRKGNPIVYGGLDLSGVPESLPLIRSERAATGFVGVKKHAQRKTFEARIRIGKKPKTLGTFDTLEEAALIYARAQWYLESKPQGKQKGAEVLAGSVEEPPHSSDTGFIADFVHRMDGKDGNDGQDADNAPVVNALDDPVDRSFMSDIDYSEVDGVAV